MRNGKITMLAPAKINLYFGVVGMRGDGYHEVETVMQTIDLFDRVEVEVCDGEENAVHISCRELSWLKEEDNVAYKAAETYLDRAELEKTVVNINIEKKIPDGAGLGGGSTDAATVLLALNMLDDERFSLAELCDMAKTIGADVPFCVKKGTVTATGFGEILESAPPMPDCRILLAMPVGEKTSTAAAYAKLNDEGYPSSLGEMKSALAECDIGKMSAAMKNDFETITGKDSTSELLKCKMKELGAEAAQMSGSGPAVFGIFGTQAEAKAAKEQLDGMAELYICAPARRDYAYLEK